MHLKIFLSTTHRENFLQLSNVYGRCPRTLHVVLRVVRCTVNTHLGATAKLPDLFILSFRDLSELWRRP